MEKVTNMTQELKELTTKAKEEKEKLRKKVENWVRHLHHSKRATRDKEFYVKEVAVYHFLLKETALAHQAGREEMKKECLAAVPEEMEAISIERYGEPSESTKEYMRSWSECREKTINNINAINTSIKEIESK